MPLSASNSASLIATGEMKSKRTSRLLQAAVASKAYPNPSRTRGPDYFAASVLDVACRISPWSLQSDNRSSCFAGVWLKKNSRVQAVVARAHSRNGGRVVTLLLSEEPSAMLLVPVSRVKRCIKLEDLTLKAPPFLIQHYGLFDNSPSTGPFRHLSWKTSPQTARLANCQQGSIVLSRTSSCERGILDVPPRGSSLQIMGLRLFDASRRQTIDRLSSIAPVLSPTAG